LAPKSIEFSEITQNKLPLRRSGSFRVVSYGTNPKPECDFLCVNHSDLPPILYCFQYMADYSPNFRHRQRVLVFSAFV